MTRSIIFIGACVGAEVVWIPKGVRHWLLLTYPQHSHWCLALFQDLSELMFCRGVMARKRGVHKFLYRFREQRVLFFYNRDWNSGGFKFSRHRIGPIPIFILGIWCYPLNDTFKSCFVSWFDAFGLAIIFRNIVIGGGSVRHIES